jgi:hypothetical protein
VFAFWRTQGRILDLLHSLLKEARMANQHLTDLQDALTALDGKVDALLAFLTTVQAAAATETDLDALKGIIDAEAAKVAAVLPPTP